MSSVVDIQPTFASVRTKCAVITENEERHMTYKWILLAKIDANHHVLVINVPEVDLTVMAEVIKPNWLFTCDERTMRVIVSFPNNVGLLTAYFKFESRYTFWQFHCAYTEAAVIAHRTDANLMNRLTLVREDIRSFINCCVEDYVEEEDTVHAVVVDGDEEVVDDLEEAVDGVDEAVGDADEESDSSRI